MSKIDEQVSSIGAPTYTDPGKTVVENITRLQKAKSDIRKAIEAKGVRWTLGGGILRERTGWTIMPL